MGIYAVRYKFARLAFAAVLSIGYTAQEALAAQSDDNAGAELAARSWLTQMDVGAYNEAWEQATGNIQQRTKQSWTQWMQERRGTLGTLLLRTTVCVRPTKAVGAEPQATYVEIEYDTDFAGLSHLFEYVKTVRGANGSWEVCWYFVRMMGADDLDRCASAHNQESR